METSLSCWLLLTLCLKSTLAGDWSVQLPVRPVCAVVRSSVVLPCSFDFPQSSNESEKVGGLLAQDDGGEVQQYKVLSEMWCLGNSRCVTPKYVFHSAGILLDPSFMGRVEYFGQPGTNNCSLRISDLRQSDSGTYVFYLITDHPTEKMPDQSGIQLLVAVSDSSGAVTVAAGPSSRVTEGEALRLACCSPAAGQRVDYTWFKSAAVGPGHPGQVWNISQATSADSGGYVCQTRTGDQAQNSTVLNIEVEYSPRDTAVSVSPVGGRLPVTLTCTSDANPPVRAFAWYRGAACQPSADKSSHPARWSTADPAGTGRTFSTSNIPAEEYGEHCCVAGNRHGSQTDTVTLRSPRTITPSDSSESRLLPIGVGVGVLLVVVAVAVCVITRKQKSTRQSSYVLAQTNPVVP
ncbi:sialoadhesin-like isoform X1 [Takifugu rubripes]|uniref:sialoadhesin-like isoform X1 n=1 Tax=Takifugu rubripes TaxID=31033 RepID=UPI00114557CF|nr:sialoadhesin-like isoform X1 [Takifugu rubripes]XP_029694115.1 sialoadhesin-like isoform X1 [Takifugu rubripes]